MTNHVVYVLVPFSVRDTLDTINDFSVKRVSRSEFIQVRLAHGLAMSSNCSIFQSPEYSLL